MNKTILWYNLIICLVSILLLLFVDWDINYVGGWVLNKKGEKVSELQAYIYLFGGSNGLMMVIGLSAFYTVFSFAIEKFTQKQDLKKEKILKERNDNRNKNEFSFPLSFRCPECEEKLELTPEERKVFEFNCKQCGAKIKPYEVKESS